MQVASSRMVSKVLSTQTINLLNSSSLAGTFCRRESLRPRIISILRNGLYPVNIRTPRITMSTKARSSSKKGGAPAVPRPSSSVLLVSPTNQILLLHRVKTSSSFPSAHVFPGGNCSAHHDGVIPPPESPDRHVDGPAYRLAAVRETFEESGILLARDSQTSAFHQIDEDACDAGRKSVHRGDVKFTEWLQKRGAVPDVDALIPFTRWVTPAALPKRFSTQMYVYFLPISDSRAGSAVPVEAGTETLIKSPDPTPTSDGGLEHTAARFLPALEWLSQARHNEIILFPPQVFLLDVASRFLSPSSNASIQELEEQRERLLNFIKDPSEKPSWAEKCICPQVLFMRKSEHVSVLDLSKPGPGIGDDRAGVHDKVALVNFSKEGPRDVKIRDRREILEEEKRLQMKEKL